MVEERAMKRKQEQKQEQKQQTMSVLYPDSAGIDVGSREHFVCVPADRDAQPIRSFASFTEDLNALAQWLTSCRIRQVALEATGVYWIPLFELLDRLGFEVILVNGRQTRRVAGRKSDVLDCQWIQQLMMFGLLSGSFRPADALCSIRAVVRQRARLIRDGQRAVQHMDKALVQMNVQLGRLLADLSGKSGLAIIRAILAGERNGATLAALCDRRVQASREEIAKSLVGSWRNEHLLELKHAVAKYDLFLGLIAECDGKIESDVVALQRLPDPPPDPRHKPRKNKRHTAQAQSRLRTMLYQAMGVDLTAIPTIEVDTALVIFTEVGPDLSCFPSSEHFCAWLNLAPGTRISGGKRLGRAPMPAINRVGEALKTAAANARKTDTFIGAAHRARLARMTKACAIKATAHQLARLIYAMVTRGQAYVEHGIDAFETEHREKQLRQLRRKAAHFGLVLTEKAA
jgi:transposase